VISTIIITATLLVILVVASFVSINILALQMADSEFQQAQSNMLLLDSVVQDVSLRQGAGSYVQFNDVSGGIGIANDTTNSMLINCTALNLNYSSGSLLTFVYNGGSQVSGTNESLIPPQSPTNASLVQPPINVSLEQPVGYLRVETGNGVKIKLDYNRVRVVSMGQQLIGKDTYSFWSITFLRLVRGNMGGSGTVNVRVQNTFVNNTSYVRATAGSVTAKLKSDRTATTLFSFSNATIVLSIVTVQVSIG